MTKYTMADFKAGDKVKIVRKGVNYDENGMGEGVEWSNMWNADMDYYIGTTQMVDEVDECGVYFEDAGGYHFPITSLEKIEAAASTYNGVDAEGNPLNFTVDDLKPFMRAVSKSEGSWIVGPDVQEGSQCFIRIGDWLPFSYFDDSDEWTIVEVYAAPEFNGRLLDVAENGKLIWKRTPPKCAQQLAQEKAIEELEAAIKLSQDKLAQLKGTL